MHSAGLVWIVLGCIAIGAVAGALATWLFVLRRARAPGSPVGDERALVRTLIDLMPDYIYAKDAAGRFVLANLAVARVMGADSPGQLIGKTDADFYSPEMAAKFRADDESVLHGQALQEREELGSDSVAGEARWHLTTKLPVRDARGEVIGLVGISRDIHRRKLAEDEIRRLNAELDQRVRDRTAELAAERHLLRTLIDNMPDAIYAKDTESRYILVNQATATGVNATPAEMLGRTVFDYYPQEQAQRFFDDDREVMRSGRALVGREEPALDRSTGGQRWLLTTKVPLRDDGGRIVGIVGISRDIGELRRVQELRVAKERAEAANEGKSRFLANMSHELRTPLNAVLGYAQILMRDEALSELQRQGLATIRNSGEHLLALIDDILDLAKVDAGRLELYPEPVLLPEFVRVIDDIIRVEAIDKKLAFRCDVPTDLPAVVGADERRLRQVLLNLLSNAVKFTDAGAVILRIAATPRDGGMARLRFEVQDSGPGIAAEQHEAIFHPFVQGGTPQGRSSGTGLGLAISRQLTRLMGGELRLESEPARGSRFWFEIDVPVLGERAVAHRPQGMVTGYEGPRRTVLIADDVPANRAVLVDLMQALGFGLVEANDGQALLASAQAHRPDLVISDLVMPVMDGFEAIERLRQLAGLADVPVIAVSANASGRDEAHSLAAGASAFLPKPIAMDRLLAKVGELLGLRWTHAPPRPVAAPDELPMVPPSGEDLNVLHRLAKVGHMRSIREYAKRLGERDERLRPFAERLRSMADRFESRAILELIERYLEAS
ncbi:MAG TPA: PAS domain-containing protein [Albitalea sp.]|uniref:PAS domain-containing sensor histidine kinase n=1 Tax=Piscinibacter sp. TaxID=1903157 RepID=UPI002ECFF865